MELEVNSQRHDPAEVQRAGVQKVHFLDLLLILTKRWRVLLSLTVSAGVIAAVVGPFIPYLYTANTLILPPSQGISGAAILGQAGGGGGLAAAAAAGLGLKNAGEIYVSLFHSRTVEDAVIQRFGLMSRYHKKLKIAARVALEGHSSVTIGPKDGLMNISVTDTDPKVAADIANGYVDEFRKFSANLALTEASQRRLFFQQQLLEANANLSAAEEARKGTQQATGVVEVGSQTQALFQTASALRSQIVDKEVQLQGMRAYATEDNPEVVEAKEQLAELQSQLAKLRGTEEDAGFIVPKGKVPEAELESTRQVRDVRYYETIWELMAKQFEVAKLDEARQGGVIQVVDAAQPPESPSYPNRQKLIIKAMLLGFFLACVWCAIAEGWQYLKGSPENRRRLDALWASFR